MASLNSMLESNKQEEDFLDSWISQWLRQLVSGTQRCIPPCKKGLEMRVEGARDSEDTGVSGLGLCMDAGVS